MLRAAAYRRFLSRVGIGTLIPGVGLILAGRRWLGSFVLAVFVAAGVVAAAYALRAGRSGLIRLGSDPDRLALIAVALAGLAAVWLLIAVVGLYLLQPSGLRFGQRLGSAFVVVVVGSLVVAPLSLGSRYAFTHGDLIDSVFADDEQHSLTIPTDASEDDPWAGQPRVNVLILGADSGDNRDGARTDTVMVASINTQSGDTALFSLPRNLQYAPMPEGPLREAYPNGFHGEPADEYWLYSIYRNVPAEFPEYFEGIADPGAEALKLIVGEALGLDISYYVMVNLRGFQYLVDALGGIELDVPYRIPIGTRTIPGVGCTRAKGWIEPGDDQQLDGYHALWFARARCGPAPINDDYERMRRQRCVIGAIAAQADPFHLLTRYQRLASAAKDTMSTDISQQRLADFAELALKVQEAGIRSLPFTNEIIDYNDPDYDLVRRFVEESLDPSESSPTPDVSVAPDGSTLPGSFGETPSSDGPSGDPDSSAAQGEPERPSRSESNGPVGAQFIDDVC